LQFPIWLQFQGLEEYYKNSKCLHIFVTKLDIVFKGEKSKAYIEKAAGL
jgi:hypothetical protein